jgi:hypothetical protein
MLTRFLLLPPMLGPGDSEALKVPLSDWITVDEYDSAQACRKELAEMHSPVAAKWFKAQIIDITWQQHSLDTTGMTDEIKRREVETDAAVLEQVKMRAATDPHARCSNR